MKLRLPLVALTAMALLPLVYTPHALADAATGHSGVAPITAAAPPQPCPPGSTNLAQLDCCKGHKGICGCRAGKIVCCDGTVSTDPNCTCRGDDAIEN